MWSTVIVIFMGKKRPLDKLEEDIMIKGLFLGSECDLNQKQWQINHVFFYLPCVSYLSYVVVTLASACVCVFYFVLKKTMGEKLERNSGEGSEMHYASADLLF